MSKRGLRTGPTSHERYASSRQDLPPQEDRQALPHPLHCFNRVIFLLDLMEGLVTGSETTMGIGKKNKRITGSKGSLVTYHRILENQGYTPILSILDSGIIIPLGGAYE